MQDFDEKLKMFSSFLEKLRNYRRHNFLLKIRNFMNKEKFHDDCLLIVNELLKKMLKGVIKKLNKLKKLNL